MGKNIEEGNPSDLVPALMVVANIFAVGIGYGITIVLARNLTHYGFEQYVGTLATLGLLASLGEAGFGKYALKIVPVYVAHNSLGLLRGYLAYAFLGCIGVSLLVGGVTLLVELPMRTSTSERVILIALFFLPAMAGFGVAVDFLLSLRRAATATLIARIIVPATTLGLLGVALASDRLSPYVAVLCFGLGSLLGMLLAAGLSIAIVVPMAREAVVDFKLVDWTRRGLSYMTVGFLISWIFKAPLVLAHHMPHGVNQLAILAPAFETGCLALLLSKSTDKYFQPTLSMVIEMQDWDYGAQVRRRRLALLGVGVSLYLATIFVFGKQILSLYGGDFESAYPALCVIAVGSSVWTIFSLAPSFLLYVGERKQLLVSLFVHGVLLAVLSASLMRYFGVMGSAVAYTVTVTSLAITNQQLAQRYIRRTLGRAGARVWDLRPARPR